MGRLIKRTSKKIGLKPGSIVYVGERYEEQIFIDVIDYTDQEYQERRIDKIEECFPYKDTSTTTWINISGIHDTALVEKLGNHFGLHPLVMEDIVNTGHRPKIEASADSIFTVLKMLYRGDGNDEIKVEQVSILFGKNWVITFQETSGDVFQMVRERIKATSPRIRFMSADYLAYTLVDAIVDNYFLVLEHIGERIEDLEDVLAEKASPESLDVIRELKSELIVLRKAIWPLREVAGGLERLESHLIHEMTQPYLRDLYEHAIQVIDTVETFRDMVSGLLDLYHTTVSNRMNEIMKVLTIIATIFIPLGFLAGVYGMNFDTGMSPFNMPELSFRYGYILFWSVVVVIGGGLFLFFRRKEWL